MFFGCDGEWETSGCILDQNQLPNYNISGNLFQEYCRYRQSHILILFYLRPSTLLHNIIMLKYLPILLVIFLACTASPTEQLTAAIQALKNERSLRGVQVQMTKNKQIVYNLNLGQKNNAGQAIDNNTLFRIASVSKSFSSVAIMQLVEQGKLALNQSLSSIFGYKLENPFFPGRDITVEMILSHTSSILECYPYYNDFLVATSQAKSGYDVPSIREILLKGGKFYNDCVYSQTHPPGAYYQYVNINFGIAGTVVEILSQQRFDEYQRDHILRLLSEGLAQIATFNVATINNTNNLGVIYQGENHQWVPTCDNYPTGKINQRNLTGYKIGDNGVLYGPQGSLRASASHLTNYAIMLANGGTAKNGRTILQPQSVREIVRPRYHYRGHQGGQYSDDHQYGLGIFTTTYRSNDQIISHEVVKGHLGAAYGLISTQLFWGEYTLTYIINGALNGYKYVDDSIYEQERVVITRAANRFAQQLQKRANLSIE